MNDGDRLIAWFTFMLLAFATALLVVQGIDGYIGDCKYMVPVKDHPHSYHCSDHP